jgi:predicted ABC-type ATPase
MPEAIIIAGANGAGKTTFARQLLPALHPDIDFLNVDELQFENAALLHPVAAGRELLRRLAERERLGQSFALETTLSSTMYRRRILRWRAVGYRVYLHFIQVPSEDFALQRVAMRVAAGGHGVPDSDVRRRYRRGLALFAQVYKPIVDEWYHWHSDEGGLRLGQREDR